MSDLNSENDTATAVNILQHIMHEEGFRDRPYIDPNGIQANIGYAHSFHFFSPEQVAASKKYVKGDPRNNYLLSLLPPQAKNLRVTEEAAQEKLWSMYTGFRQKAKEWLGKEGIKPSGRLVDQLGMLFYGATGDAFRKSYLAKTALEKVRETGDEGHLSLAASRWGRSAQGVVLPVLQKRRDAEHAFYTGSPLPVGKEKADKVPKVAPAFGVERGDDSDEELRTNFESVIGREGVKKANELTWKVIGDGSPMPDDFDATLWAKHYLDDQGPSASWQEDAVKMGVGKPPASGGMPHWQDEGGIGAVPEMLRK